MDKVFLRYLDPAFRYVKSQTPALVRCRDDALRDGLNCVALAHLVIRDLFGYVLPAHLQALELVRDLEHFEPVPDPEHMMTPTRCGRCEDSATTTGTGPSTQSGGCDGSFRAVKTSATRVTRIPAVAKPDTDGMTKRRHILAKRRIESPCPLSLYS
jgi:hypothetical protein